MLFRYENIKNSHSFIMPSLLSEQRNSLDVRWDFLFMVTTEIEIWKPIPDWDGYEVSSFGNVRSYKCNSGKLLTASKPKKTRIDAYGYPSVGLYNGTKVVHLTVHVLIGKAFLGYIPDRFSGYVLDHKDNIRKNSRLSNLQIITRRENRTKDLIKSTTPFVGVCLIKKTNKWSANVQINNKKHYLGRFNTDSEASYAYDVAVSQINNGTFNPVSLKKTSPDAGVVFDTPRNKWRANAWMNNKNIFLGRYKTKEEALAARKSFTENKKLIK